MIIYIIGIRKISQTPQKSRLGRLKPCFTSLSMPVCSCFQVPHVLFWKRRNLSYAALSFHLTESRLKVSRAHAANYWDGPMYNGLVDVVCPTHILAKREVRPNPPPPLRTPLYVALCIRMSCVLLFNAANRTVLTQLRAWVSRTLHITMPHVLVTKLMTRLLIVAFYIVTILVLAFYTTDPDTFSNS